jgi:hypothetical protein
MKWASVDPGANGAIVVWEDDKPLHIILLRDTVGYKRELNRLDPEHQLLQDVRYAVVEKVRGMTWDGAASAFNFGWTCGILHQYFRVTHYVSPQEWMNAMHRGLPKATKTKERSKHIANKLYGEFIKDYQKASDDGVWDAILIGGYWLWRTACE